MNKPLILVTNDDSIVSPGIRTLIEVMKTIGDVVVVAPDSPQSAMGHAITINNTLHIDKIRKKRSKSQKKFFRTWANSFRTRCLYKWENFS